MQDISHMHKMHITRNIQHNKCTQKKCVCTHTYAQTHTHKPLQLFLTIHRSIHYTFKKTEIQIAQHQIS